MWPPLSSEQVCSWEEAAQSQSGSYIVSQFQFQLRNVPNPTLANVFSGISKQKGRNSLIFHKSLTVPLKRAPWTSCLGTP